MIPFHNEDLVTIYNGDCVEGMKCLPEQSVNLVVTSPPYNIYVKYDNYQDNLPWDNYLSWCNEWLTECYRLLHDDGRIAVNVSLTLNQPQTKETHFHVAEIASIMAAVGFKFRSFVVWPDSTRRYNSFFGSWMSASSPYFFTPYEGIIIGYKKQWKRKSKGITTITKDEFVRLCRGVWNAVPETRPLTPAAFPEAIPSNCIKLLSYEDDVVLDPFLGSGTTAKVAKELKRNCIGFDISKEYCSIARKRIF